MFGFTPIRTVRFISILIAIVGMFFLFVERVLNSVILMAQNGLQMAFARYDNFTGRMALQNFQEDKQLYTLLQDVQSMLPSANHALSILFIVGIILIVISFFGCVFPKQFAHILTAFKLLKWQVLDVKEQELESPISLSKKKIIIGVFSLFVLILIILLIRSCSESTEIEKNKNAGIELSENGLAYINAQKSFFEKNKRIGNAKDLKMDDSLKTDVFTYKITSSKFIAVSNIQLGQCPIGSKWSISSSKKGFFSVDLVLYRAAPKDTNCVKLAPDFKNLGRKVKK